MFNKKSLKKLLAVVSFAVIAPFALACGDGEPKDVRVQLTDPMPCHPSLPPACFPQ